MRENLETAIGGCGGERFRIGVRVLTFQAMIGNPRSESNHVYVRQSSLYLIMMLSNKAMWFLICASTNKQRKRVKQMGEGGTTLIQSHTISCTCYFIYGLTTLFVLGFFLYFKKAIFINSNILLQIS